MLEHFWADVLDPKDPLVQYRKKGWDRFEKIGLPKPKQEAFQYLLKKLSFPKPAERKEIQKDPLQGIVFVDGFFEEKLSRTENPIICISLEEALRKYSLFLQNRLSSSFAAEKDPFAALNSALFGRGAFLFIPSKCKAALHLTQIYTGGEMASGRLQIYLGKGAELTLTQESKGQSGFANLGIDIVLDSNARLTLIDRAEGDFQAIRATVKKESELKGIFLGRHLRTSIRIELMEECAETHLLGLACLEGNQERHFHTQVEHRAPLTRSKQHFKSVLKGKSRFSFEGKIFVSSEAQKTEGYQRNSNLILGDEAFAFAKPNLEIFADDVKASHGSTTASLNEEEIFYLRSRGVPLNAAQELLIRGFCKEITDHAP